MNQDKTSLSFLKSIRNEEIKNTVYLLERAWNYLTCNMKANDIDYENLSYKSGGHEEFRLDAYGSLASLYLKLSRGKISLIKAESNLKDFKNEIKSLDSKGVKKGSYKTNKKNVLRKY